MNKQVAFIESTMANTALFPPELATHRQLIDDALASWCKFDDDCPARLREAIEYVVLSPGKRIRPLLVLAAAEACSGNVNDALPGACAVEFIHNYSLIHDDLPAMDDDELRRGRPTCHIAFDEATAILAGDAMIPLAFEVLSSIEDSKVAAESCRVLSRAAGASQLVGGQVDDLDAEFADRDVEVLEKIHRRKTGALLTASLELGAVSAKAGSEQRNKLASYGQNLGLAFQIADDLLDFRGSQTKMGKRTGKDADRGKMTYPSVLGEAESESRLHLLAEQAVADLKTFGDLAKPLEQLARFVVHRTT